MPLVAISVGSNLDREHNIDRALESLRLTFGQLRTSRVYETAAVGFNGPDFYNLVVVFETDLNVRSLIDRLHDIEAEQGRTRTPQETTSRAIDLDLLLYGDGILYSEGLDIPRRESLKYDFVLQPLAELLPDTVHPVSGDRLEQLLDQAAWSLGPTQWQPLSGS
jgi:2-amino-4-hydroxy-6-hydroxymethyldihydropteridine diphosphokinase